MNGPVVWTVTPDSGGWRRQDTEFTDCGWSPPGRRLVRVLERAEQRIASMSGMGCPERDTVAGGRKLKKKH